MTTRTWNGATDNFFNPIDWTPNGAPQPGDTAIINSGAASVAGGVPNWLTLQLNGSPTAAGTLSLNNGSIPANTRIAGSSTGSVFTPAATINVQGSATNNGIITFSSDSGRFAVSVSGNAGAGGSLNNQGSFDVLDATVSWSSPLSGPLGSLQNDGMISVWNPANGFESAAIALNLSGSGVVQLNPHSSTAVGDSVASTQMIDFTGGSGAASTFEIAHPQDFAGAINGFAQGDTIRLMNTPYDGFTYNPTSANTGVLRLYNVGVDKAELNFNGVYQASDFNIAGLNQNTGAIDITTTAHPAQLFSFTNSTVGQSSTDAGVAYTGPVVGVQHQYIWSSPDSVAIAANTPSVFAKGGAGDDALSVTSGTNVLDGGAGSNFLVGSADPNSRDTFFVDGRNGQVTWSTIVNFHFGDQATFFGFHPGTSTLPFTASDGVAGFQGVTIHSELNGAGTGVNASMTFAGIDQNTLNQHFTITSGSLAGGVDYLLIQYDH